MSQARGQGRSFWILWFSLLACLHLMAFALLASVLFADALSGKRTILLVANIVLSVITLISILVSLRGSPTGNRDRADDSQ